MRIRKLALSSVICLISVLLNLSCHSASPVPLPPDRIGIELHNGKAMQDYIESYNSNVFTLKNEGKLSRDEVKQIIFIMQQADLSPDTSGQAGEKPNEAKQNILPSQIKELLDKADEATKKYPYSNGIILLDDGYHVLNQDGSRKYRYHFIGKVLTNKTKEWANLSLYFEEERNRNKIVMGHTITPDGKVLGLDLSTVQITEPSREMEFFGKGKIMSATLPGVEVGCLVEYIIEVDDFNPADKNMFDPSFFFQDKDPVLESRMTIIIPADKELNYVTKNMSAENAKPKITNTKDTKTYIWELKDVPPLMEEPNMPSLSDVVPRLEACIFKDWTYLNDWGSNILKERIKATPEITKLVQELTKDAKTIEDKIAAIYYFAQNEIRYISIKGSTSSGWGGHPAYQTLQNKYGDCIDKAILFTTMLREIGVEAYPVTVLTNDSGTAIRDIPILNANHAIVELHLNGKMFFLDPVTQYFRYPYFNPTDHGITAVNPLTGKINFIEVPPPDHNMKSYITELALKSDGTVEGSVRGDYTGDYEAGLRGFWQSVPEVQRGTVFQQIVGNLSPGGRLLDFSVINQPDCSKQLSLTYKYSLPEYPIFAGNMMIFGIPGLQYDFPEIAMDERQYDLVYTTSQEIKHSTSIKIPEGYEIKYLPNSVDLSCSPYATYKASYKYQPTTNTILFEDDFKMFKRIIPVKDYQKYEAFLQQASTFSKEKIFFSQKNKEGE